MKLIKTVFKWLLGVLVLLALLLGLALVPDFQTWIAQSMLARHPELHTTIGSLSVGFGEIEAEDVRVEMDGVLFTLPAVTVKLPVIEALRERTLTLHSLVAKDWTVEPYHLPDPVVATAEPSVKADDASDASTPSPTPSPEPTPITIRSAEKSLRAFSGFLTGWHLPCDFSADGIDVDGDLLVPGTGKERTRVHLTAQGGGIGVGHEGSLSISSSETFVGTEIVDLNWHGDLVIAMDTPRTVARIAAKGTLSASGTTSSPAFALGTDFAVSRDAAAENYSVDLLRDDRHLLKLDTRFETDQRQLAGTWAFDGRNGDLGPLVDDHSLPPLTIAGTGKLAVEAGLTQLRATGELRVTGDMWKLLGIGWNAPRSATTTTRFDLTANDNELKIDHWTFALSDSRPVMEAGFSQPVAVDLKTFALSVKYPEGILGKLSLQKFPLDWFSGLTGGLSLGGDATGEFQIKASGHNIELRPLNPLIAHHVSFQRNGRILTQNLDFMASFQANKSEQGWQLEASNASVNRNGRMLAMFEANASQPLTDGQPLEIKGKWSSNVAALFELQANPISQKNVQPLSGEFSAILGEDTQIASTLKLPTPDGASLQTKISAEIGSDRAIAFHVPLEMKIGQTTQSLSLDGNWAQTELGNEISIGLSSKDLDLKHLHLLDQTVAILREIPFAPAPRDGSAGSSIAKDSSAYPMWGDIIGGVTITIDHYGDPSDALNDLHANIRFNRDSIRLITCLYRSGPQFCTAKGALLFEPAAEFPYRLQESFEEGEIDAAQLFATPPPDTDPLFHGNFAVSSTVTGTGVDLGDLIHRSQEEIKLTSKGGICRLLKTDVSNAMPAQSDHPVGDAATTVGSLVGKLAGIDKKGGGQIRVGKTTDAVLNFSYDVAEIGYQEITMVVIRKFETPLRLKELSLLAPDEHITGSGEMTDPDGVAITNRPIQVDLKFGFRGKAAEQLNLAGLLSNEKDKLGYTLMKQPVHIGGTLQNLDLSRWHDLLAEAAFRKPVTEK